MLVTPSNSRRTVKPATAVTNHMKVRRRENAGRRRRIAFHQIAHSDRGSARSGMVVSMVQVGSGHSIGTIDSQFVNHDWAHDPDTTRRLKFAACRHSAETRRKPKAARIPAPLRQHGYPGPRAAAPTQNGP